MSEITVDADRLSGGCSGASATSWWKTSSKMQLQFVARSIPSSHFRAQRWRPSQVE